MSHCPITEHGATTLREAVTLAVQHVIADGGDETSTNGGPWVQNSCEYGDSGPGKVAQSYAAAHGTRLTDWHPMPLSSDPKEVLAVDFRGRISDAYGNIAAHIAVIGGWKYAVRDPYAPLFRLPSVYEAATSVLTGGCTSPRYVGDPVSPARIFCDGCPFESTEYGYFTFESHDLYATRNTIAALVHIADLILARDGWASTGVTAPQSGRSCRFPGQGV